MWGVFSLVAPSVQLSPSYRNLKEDAPYPFAVPVDQKIDPLDVMSVLRSWYNGTKYSPSVGECLTHNKTRRCTVIEDISFHVHSYCDAIFSSFISFTID